MTRPLRLRGGAASRDSANHERPREEWIEIPVPAIVDESTFARAQELLHENKVHARRRTIEPSLVQGLVSCQKCGYALSRASARSSARKIHYYRCIGSDGWRHLGGPRCDTRPVRQDLLDEVVWTEVIRLLEEPALIQQELDRRLAAAQAADPAKTRTQAVERDLTRVGKSMEGNAQRPKLPALLLRDKDLPYRLGPVGPRLQVPRQRFQPPVHPERLNVRNRLAVHPGRAVVATNGLPGDHEHVIAPHLVAQRVEPEVRSFLRFRM